MRRWAHLAVAAIAIALPVPPPGSQEPADLGTLDATHPLLKFNGGVANPTPLPLVNPPAPVVCEVTCQAFTFNAITTAPFLVAVKDAAASQNNGWDLFVYGPAGRLVASANGIGANGQAVTVEHPTAGKYRIFVSFTYTYDPAGAYLGEVRLMTSPTWLPAVPGALPALRAEPPHDLHIDGVPPAASTPLGFPLPVSFPTGFSCYLDETLQLGATRCLRFTSNVGNIGGALLDLRLSYDGITCRAEQLIEGAAPRPAGDCLFHPTHGHFHYQDFVGFSLHRLRPDRRPGPQVGSGLKQSFCLGDNDYFGFGTPGPNGPRSYAGQPDCSVPAGVDGAGAVLAEGLTPGWSDVYTWDTPGQIVDITNVPPGEYALVEKTNPAGAILVAGPPQTCAMTILRLTASAVSAVSSHASVACP
jgi:hypothetical protein